MDVGVEGNDLKPYLIDDIIKIMGKREVGSEMSDDHHLDDIIGIVGWQTHFFLYLYNMSKKKKDKKDSIINWELHQKLMEKRYGKQEIATTYKHKKQ